MRACGSAPSYSRSAAFHRLGIPAILNPAILKTMRFSVLHIRLNLLLLPLVAVIAIGANAQSPSATVTPAIVEAGAPELIRVTAPANAKIEGEWLGHTVQFF